MFKFKNSIDGEKWSKRDFFLWLECYEFITKEEFEELPKYKKENYKYEFKMFRKGRSQYNRDYLDL